MIRHSSVLLTGATGSLGGYLCAELLSTTPASVHCLVRAAGRDAARARVTARLHAVEDPPLVGDRRLTAGPADLEHPLLGLRPKEYDALAESVTTIVHCAASVDLAAGYEHLAPANLGATQNLIAFARRREQLVGRPPAFHYVSTLGVLLGARRTGSTVVDESTEVSEETSGPLGYPRSKAAAEVALWRAAEDGLPVTMHRPAAVTGHSRTGRTSTSDLLTPLMWAAVGLGTAPTCTPELPAERVDIVARAIVTLLAAPGVAGRAFHLVHPQHLRLSDLFAALRRAGHVLEPVPAEEWWRRVEKHADHPAVHPMASMSEVARYMLALDAEHTLPHIRSEATWTTLATRGMHPDPLGESFLDRLVSHLAPPARALTSPHSTPQRAPVTPPPAPSVRIDGCLTPHRFGHTGAFPAAAAAAAACEAAGYGMFWAQEQTHDPVPALAAAITSTHSIGLGTSVLVALARSPMTVAHTAHDLHALSGGRFVLGLGPQFRANLVYRFSMPGDRRLARLREHVAALRAIWAYWNEGKPLDFRGEFTTHVLTNPFFTPPPNPHGPPPVMLAATGPRAAELAGEIADGVMAPPYANRRHLAEVLLPAVERGLARSGRSRDEFTVVAAPLLAISPEDTEHARRLVALWCATRAYRSVFEPYELGRLADELAELSMSDDPDRWLRMTDRIDDDVLGLFALRPAPGRLGAELQSTLGGLADRVIVPAPVGSNSPYNPAQLGLAAADSHLKTP